MKGILSIEMEYIKSLLNNLDRLVLTNGLLAEAYQKAQTNLDRNQKEKEQLMIACREIYEGLSAKKKRSVAEESWYTGLEKVLRQES